MLDIYIYVDRTMFYFVACRLKVVSLTCAVSNSDPNQSNHRIMIPMILLQRKD